MRGGSDMLGEMRIAAPRMATHAYWNQGDFQWALNQ